MLNQYQTYDFCNIFITKTRNYRPQKALAMKKNNKIKMRFIVCRLIPEKCVRFMRKEAESVIVMPDLIRHPDVNALDPGSSPG